MSKKLEIWLGIATIVIMVIALIPSFGGWLLPHDLPLTSVPATIPISATVIVITAVATPTELTNTSTPSPMPIGTPISPTSISSTPLPPTNTPQSLIITVPTVQALSNEQLCTYNIYKYLLVDKPILTGEGNVESYNLTQSEFPDGYIIGNGVDAYYDDIMLGQGGVTFIIEIANRLERGTLYLKDGIFYIVSPENAEGFLALRVKQIEDCEEKQRGYVRYP